MISVRVRMLGALREASGKAEEVLSFEGEVDVDRVIRGLIEEHGDALGTALLDPVLRSPLPNALILLNGVEVNDLHGLGTRAGNGDTLTLIPVAHIG